MILSLIWFNNKKLNPEKLKIKIYKKVLKKIYNKIMTTDDQIRDEKLKYDIDREASKI